MLPIDTILGHLDILEIYEYMDGPRLFAARNNIGLMFLVFWCDEESDATGWLYLPISEEKLNKLRRRTITLNDAFMNPEMDYYLAYTGIPPRKDTASLVRSSDIDTDLFPPVGYYIEYVDVVNEQIAGWSFEAILRGTQHSAEEVSQFIGRFRELTEEIMSNLSGKTSRLYPRSASTGSIKIKFGADDNNYAAESLRIIDQLLLSNNGNEFREQLISHKIDPSQLRDFFSSVLRNKLNVEIAPKLASDGDTFALTVERVEQCIEYLDDVNYVTVDSIKIPQANDLNKVLEVVKMMNEGIPLIHENIEGLNTERQVKYYTDAAYALGLATKERQLTAAGHFVISHTDQENQFQILADRFESTDFGWAWMKWAQVQYMTDLKPETAKDFLTASVHDLSEDTAGRRASTLRRWLTELQPYHRKYRSE